MGLKIFITRRKAEIGLNTLGDDGSGIISRQSIALCMSTHFPLTSPAAGLGFGSMSGVMQYNMVLDAIAGPGALPSPGCTNTDFAVISGEHAASM